MGGQIFKWQCFWWLRFAVVKWKMYSQSPFMWLCCLPPLSRSLCLTLMVCYKMWRVDVHLVTEKKIHFSYAPNFIWMTILPGQGLALSPSISFSHISISQFQSFILCSENSPLLKVGRPSLSAAVLKIIITHSASLHIYIYILQIHFRMNDAENKNSNPQKTRTRTLSQNLLLRVKPVSLCEANEQASL